MKFDHYAEEVLAKLGPSVPTAIAHAIVMTKADLSEYREFRPRWVAEHSERGLANWIHDRMWAHLVEQLDTDPDVSFRDVGPTREFRVGMQYLFRGKRHSLDDRIRSYPTQTALSFWMQGHSSLFPNSDEVRLACGYRWDRELREIREAVISLRDGADNIVWAVTVEFALASGAVQLRPLTQDAPELPIVELSSDEDDAESDETGTE
jgi:hypothetical protein